MPAFDYDLFVIGGGSGGVRAARTAAAAGARVAVAEEHRFGGACVIRGCIPKKILVYAAGYAEAFADAAGYGWTVGETRFDWARLIGSKDREIARLEGVYARLLDTAGCDLHRCRATVAGPHEVRLAEHDRLVTARHILIATGGAPYVPDLPGAHLAVTSNEAFELPHLPRRVLIVGGGYIACEFAGIFAGLGAAVTQVYRGPMILRGFDDDVRAHVAAAMRARGVDLRIEEDVEALTKERGATVARLASGGVIEADLVMYATGRRPATRGLGLEALGVALTPTGAVAVDAYSQTAVPSIYAVGDVTDRLQLTPVAIREGQAFADTVFGGRPTKPEHVLVPSAVFTRPEIGSVGATEAEARAAGPVEIYRTAFRPMQNVLAGRDERMLMKLVVAADTRRVLGVHIVGPAAAEMIQLAAVAVRMGATKDDFDRTVAVHPTAAEELVTLRSPVA